MTSRYLFYLILLHIGLAWLVGLMWLKSAVLGHIFWTTQIIDTLFMAYCIDMALVSLLVPISLLLDKQTTQIFSILALMVGMSVMLFTHSLIVSQAFTASQFPAMFTFPTVIFLFSLLNFRKVFKEKSCC